MPSIRFLRSKSLWLAIASIITALAVAIFAMSLGVSMVGGVDAWQRMLERASPLLFVWRCVVYAGMVWCWLWLKNRVIERDPSAEAKSRLRRVEVAVGITVVLFELVKAGFI